MNETIKSEDLQNFTESLQSIIEKLIEVACEIMRVFQEFIEKLSSVINWDLLYRTIRKVKRQEIYIRKFRARGERMRRNKI